MFLAFRLFHKMVESDRIIGYLYHVGVRNYFNHFRKWLQAVYQRELSVSGPP